MRLGAAWALVRLNLARDRRGASSSIFGITVGVASLVFFVALGFGVANVVREKIFPVDATLVDVVPAQLNLGLLGGGKLDAATVERLAALPGVARVYRKMNVRVPAVTIYDGDFFGRPLRMGLEVLTVGVEPDFVSADVKLGEFKDPGPGQAIPAVAASRLLEIYNKSFAPARGLPQLGPAMLLGFTFPVDFNRSFVTAAGGRVTSAKAQLVGVSERGLLAGITIPLETARRLNREAGADADTFTAVVLQAADPSAVPALIAQVKDMGLRVDDQERRLSENVGAAVAITTSALALLSVLICVLAAFNIAHALSASVRARERELAVFRAVGASRADVATLVLFEAALLGLVGGLVGAALAWGASRGVDLALARWVPDFPFKPSTLFVWPGWLLAAGLALGVLAALVGAVLPARRAQGIDPARALAGGAA